jgi:hypothetical protein
MEVDDIFPEEQNERAPIVGGALESVQYLEDTGSFTYVRSCACCGHWFLFHDFPLEVCLDPVGRTVQAYSLSPEDDPFIKMIVPAVPGQRYKYLDWFLQHFEHAWVFAGRFNKPYIVPYKDMPGHPVNPF